MGLVPHQSDGDATTKQQTEIQPKKETPEKKGKKKKGKRKEEVQPYAPRDHHGIQRPWQHKYFGAIQVGSRIYRIYLFSLVFFFWVKYRLSE